MTRILLDLPDDLAERMDGLSGGRANRTAFVCDVITKALNGSTPRRRWRVGAIQGPVTLVRLSEANSSRLDQEASVLGFTRSSWLTALVEHRFFGRARFSRADELALIGIQTDLRRIGEAMVQWVQVAQARAAEDERLALDVEFLLAVHAEIRGHMKAIRAAFEGNLAYWKVDQ
jgi:hypothetical protein